MQHPTDNEVVFALTRATTKEMFARGYAKGKADAARPRNVFLPVLIGVIVGATIASAAWWGGMTWMP